jgi:hypothetical protein
LGDPKRAAAAITRLLDNNDEIKTPVIQSMVIDKAISEKSTAELVVESIRLSIAHHSNNTSRGDSRSASAQTFVNNVVTAGAYGYEKNGINVNDTDLARTLGTTTHQIRIGRETARQIISTDKPVSKLQRKENRNKIREKAKIPVVFEFIQDDKPSRLDTRQGTVKVHHPRTGEEEVLVHKRIWKLYNKTARFDLFLQSDAYRTFQEENNGATIGFMIFSEACSRFKCMICDPISLIHVLMRKPLGWSILWHLCLVC